MGCAGLGGLLQGASLAGGAGLKRLGLLMALAGLTLPEPEPNLAIGAVRPAPVATLH